MEEINMLNWKDRVAFSDEGPVPQTVIDDGVTRVILGGLKQGQVIPVHPEEKAVFNILDGEGVMTINGTEHPVKQGSVIMVPAGTVRGLKAETQLVFMTVRITPPGA